ncbi:Pc20g11090, partial [Penicillium rubens Wisconsin 54-1255]
CWYRQSYVGLMAVSDAVLLKSSVFVVLKFQFSGHPAYVDMIEIFMKLNN